MSKHRPSYQKALNKQKSGVKLTYNEKRTLTYNKLQDMGFDIEFARANRNNFSLVSTDTGKRRLKRKQFRLARKKQIDKIVKTYYTHQLDMPEKMANRKKGNRKQVWKETLKYLRHNEIRLDNEPTQMPNIPVILHDYGVKMVTNTWHYLNPKESYIKAFDELQDMNSAKLLAHAYRLDRFFVTQTPENIEKFVNTLHEQSELDDYYKYMSANSAENPEYEGDEMEEF